MIKWYKLIKFVKQQRKKGFFSFKVVVTENEFVIWNDANDETLRIKF